MPPWPDMEGSCAAAVCPFALWSRNGRLTPFDSVGFSLQYELSYTKFS